MEPFRVSKCIHINEMSDTTVLVNSKGAGLTLNETRPNIHKLLMALVAALIIYSGWLILFYILVTNFEEK